MYTNHYNLKEMPFEEAFNPRYIWLGKKYLDALVEFKTVLFESKGFYLFTGDSGTGKTYLAKRFLNEIDPHKFVATIPYPDLDKYSFFNYLSEEFKMNRQFNDKGLFLLHFRNFLFDADQKNLKIILLIDEAQMMNQELLEEINLLSNIKKDKRKLLDIVFVGQPSFNKVLMQEQNSEFTQKIAATFHLEPLTENETKSLVLHRLKTAGAKTQIFTPEALREIYRFSSGYPRLVITICYRALLTGFVKEVKLINEEIITECTDELRIKQTLKSTTVPESVEDAHPVRGAYPAAPYKSRDQIRSPLRKYPLTRKKPGRQKALLAILIIVLSLAAGYRVYMLMPDVMTGTKSSPEQTKSPVKAMVDPRTASLPPPENKHTQDEPFIKAGSESGAPTAPNQRTPLVGSTQSTPQSMTDRTSPFNNAPLDTQAKRTPNQGPGNLPAAPAVDSTRQTALQKPSLKNDAPKTEPANRFQEKRASTGNGNRSGNESGGAESAKPYEPSGPEEGRAAHQAAALTAASQARVSSPAARPTTNTSPLPRFDMLHAEDTSAVVKPAGPGKTIKENGRISTPQPGSERSQITYITGPELESLAVRKESTLSDIGQLVPEFADSGLQTRITMPERLRSFLDSYCETYSAGDLEKLRTYYSPDARENGQPFNRLLSKYRRDFAAADAISYQIELQEYLVDRKRGTIKIEGRFFHKWLPRGSAWRQNSGNVYLELKETDLSFKVFRLDYQND